MVGPSSTQWECYIFFFLGRKTQGLKELDGSHCHYFSGSRGNIKVDRIQPRKFVLLVFVTFVNDRLY